ncbi:MAG: thioesterase domain-containing protein [Janthinobacterium lividum]
MRDVYLFPGIVGSSYRLAQLIVGISHVNSVHSVSYPGMRSKTESICNINNIAEYVCKEIVLNNGNKHIIIIGYSFGGCVALEAGPLLKKEGMVIDEMFIIDAPIPGIVFDLDRSKMLGLLAPRTPFKQAIVRAVQLTFFLRKVRIVLLWFLYSIKRDRSKKLERFIIRSLREIARRKSWIPHRESFSGLLFISEQFCPVTFDTWIDLCPNMSPIIIDADHLSLLNDGPLSVIAHHLSLYTSSKNVGRDGT